MSKDQEFGGLEDLSTCEISDALIKLGVVTGGYIPELTLFSPSGETGVKVIGPAFTVQMVAEGVINEGEEPPKTKEHFVDACPSGSVMVISAPFIRNAGCWGGLMSTAASAKNIRGAIIRGGCRDLAEHRALSFPVFASYHTTLGQKSFVRPSELNVPVRMEPLSYATPEVQGMFEEKVKEEGLGIVVNPGDVVVADEDGVVVVPKARVGEVAKLGREGREVDERVRKDLEEGKGVKESMAKWRGGGGKVAGKL
ncbi:hypothetical protein IAT38_004418 [Cryptococcus sp. DSM 104549]